MRALRRPFGAAPNGAGERAGLADRTRAFLRRPPALLAYAAFTAAVFLLVLAYTLPHELIATRALAAATAGAPVAVTFRDVGFAFPNGYRFAGLRIAPLRAPESAVTLDELTVRTPLLGLLFGSPRSAWLSGRAFGGTLTGSVALRGDRNAVELDLDGADLGQATASLVPPPGQVVGRAHLELSLSGDGRTAQSNEGSVRLTVRGLELRDVAVRGVAVPELSFPDLALSAQIFGPRLQVKELRASGDALNLDATGDVLMRDPPPQSVLNLRLTIEVGPTAPPALRVATALLPRRGSGERPVYNVSGTVAVPVLR